MEKLKFVHLTDTHMNAPGADNPFAKLNLADKVKRVFEHVNAASVKPAFVVITGDLTHEGNVQDYEYIRSIVDEGSALLGVPVHVVLGNHDHRAPFREGFLKEAPSEQAYYYSHTIQGFRLIGLNSQVKGQHHGEIDAEQLAWLEETLSTPAEHGTIVALHHPMLNINGMPGDHVLANREQLGNVLEGTDVIGVVAGHVHTNNVGTYKGICHVAATGTAFGGEAAEDNHFKMVDFCGYNVVSVYEEGVTVQTIVMPGMQDEFFRFPVEALMAHN
ncbi:3',5'-cyclic adenosine monophosphate phosphodiesterase CpdA [Paenibacillus glycanilyticus]|uniref:3',5'-cyclic adenosine monophosphate phosphodiesterase CpdA n=1 Tax=Paenibacillus glycanilyticus TaxID=126569 RepID=A0ABQ6NEV2_9BACL|nr:metallophosphoesterase [Paenibacillus glycanilyticus]GMK43625.1 3',5'-cyclic adenosine monophosphate phosphodiesterase CpdA [Paenibacillus glycanilyticus]